AARSKRSCAHRLRYTRSASIAGARPPSRQGETDGRRSSTTRRGSEFTVPAQWYTREARKRLGTSQRPELSITRASSDRRPARALGEPIMSLSVARRLRAFCVVVALSVSVINSPSAYSDSADCEQEASSVAGYSVRSMEAGVSPGSTPAPNQPGASNASDDRARIYVEVYNACMRRQAPSASEPSASRPGARQEQR